MNATLSKKRKQNALSFFHTADRQQHQRYSWGSSVVISGGNGYIVKEYFILPDGEIQSHCHMESTEHWTILEGAVMFTMDGNKVYMANGDSCLIRLGVYHSLKNVSRYPVHGFMVQCGRNLSIKDVYIK